MKYTILSSLFLVMSFSIKAQLNKYKITYRHCVEIDTLKHLVDTIGVQALLIGDQNSSNYTFLRETNNLLGGKITKEKTEKEIFSSKLSGLFKTKIAIDSDSIGNMLYNDKKKRIVYLREKMYDEYVITAEPTPIINWTITNETKIIKNYTCYKAIANFRGRNYTAWFTTDIAIIAAPWKFYGLPGLVLDITDEKNQVRIYVTHIEYPTHDNIIPFSENGKKITLNEYFTWREKSFNKKIKATQAMLDNQPYMKEIIEQGGERPVAKAGGVPYNIEIHY